MGAHTKVKFCGITSVADAEAAVSLGAWAVGINLWPGSRRAVGVLDAAEISAAVKRRAEAVGVFVNPTLAELTEAAHTAELTIIQLHGDEGPVFCTEAARRTGCRVIKAISVAGLADMQALGAFHTDFHLLDAAVPGERGGTGQTFSWELARAHRGSVPVILSGGLTAENVAGAIDAVAPYAVDVASGIEVPGDPRRKDHARMAAFMRSTAERLPA